MCKMWLYWGEYRRLNVWSAEVAQLVAPSFTMVLMRTARLKLQRSGSGSMFAMAAFQV